MYKEAKKRQMVKRFLTKNHVTFDVNDTTYNLVALARYTQHVKKRIVTAERIVEIARDHHYLRQLVAVKMMWGVNAHIGFVGYGDCRTIDDLVKADACPPSLAYLDKYLHLIANRMDLRNV